MSWIKDLFGGGNNAKNDALKADATAAERERQAQAAAQAQIDRARGDLTGALSGAQEHVDKGLAQGRTDIMNALTQSRADLGAGKDAALGYYKSYQVAGEKAQKTYSDVLGLNGAEAAAAGVGAYKSNPYLAQEQERAAERIRRHGNATGRGDYVQGRDGTGSLAAARATEELGYKDYTDWKDRLASESNKGVQVAGSMAGIEQDTAAKLAAGKQWAGGTTASLEQGAGATKSNNALTNATSIANLGVKGAEMDWGAGMRASDRAINLGNTFAESRNDSWNKMMQLGGLAATAYGGWGANNLANALTKKSANYDKLWGNTKTTFGA